MSRATEQAGERTRLHPDLSLMLTLPLLTLYVTSFAKHPPVKIRTTFKGLQLSPDNQARTHPRKLGSPGYPVPPFSPLLHRAGEEVLPGRASQDLVPGAGHGSP